jgi:AcrR family transcriptional regulator
VTVRRNEDSVKRPYHSPRRDVQAKATRTAILDSARDLFLRDGYAATSIEAVAERAEVSRQTVYDVFGDKASLLYAVGERVVMSQDVPGPIAESERWGALVDEPDPHQRVRMVARMSREMWEEGMVDFEWMTYEAAANDPRLRDMLQQAIQQKRRDTEAIAAVLVPEEIRTKDVSSFDKIVDLITAIDSAYLVRTLVNDFGWSYDDYETWLATMLERLILAEGR